MRELPFGARIAESFVEKLKCETAKANGEWSGVLPSLCVEEKQRHETLSGQYSRPVDLFQQTPEIPPVNRLVPPRLPPTMLIKERIWVLCFVKRKHRSEATFEIDGVQLHISKQAQAELKGATIRVANDKVVVTYEPI